MEFTEDDPTKKDVSISMEQANYYTIIGILPVMLPIVLLFSGLWGGDAIIAGYTRIMQSIFWFLLAVIIGVVIHEYIHKIGWAVFGKKPFSVIKFGFQWKTLTPYAHCTEPMEVNGYRWGAILPGLLLGVLPILIAILNGNGTLFIYGLLFLFAAGGDFLILWLIRNVKTGTEVEDHPTRAGCYVFNKEGGQS
jgi:hypothetical protein